MAVLTESQILYEDNHIIAVNKECGEITQGDISGDEPLTERVKYFLKEKYHKPGNVFIGLPHRIDRPASGIVLFAKTSKVLPRLNQLFQGKNGIRKIYWAVVDKMPPQKEAHITHYLVKNEEKNKSFAYNRPGRNLKESSLSYTYLTSSDRYHLLQIELHTGRHHQIRAQLAKIGCHIKGDLKYGFPRSNPDAGIHLHARELTFIHPVKKIEVKIIANPPKDKIWDYFLKKLE